jgi:hypothetical protein
MIIKMMNIRKPAYIGLLGLVLTGASMFGCSKQGEINVPQKDPNAPIVKIETKEGYKEARVVGRNYYPGLHIKKNIHVSYGIPVIEDSAHSHDIPIEIDEPEKYFLFIELDNRTFVKEVNNTLYRDAPNNSIIMAKYKEKREVSYKPNVAETEIIEDKFSDLEILSLELKNKE